MSCSVEDVDKADDENILPKNMTTENDSKCKIVRHACIRLPQTFEIPSFLPL